MPDRIERLFPRANQNHPRCQGGFMRIQHRNLPCFSAEITRFDDIVNPPGTYSGIGVHQPLSLLKDAERAEVVTQGATATKPQVGGTVAGGMFDGARATEMLVRRSLTWRRPAAIRIRSRYRRRKVWLEPLSHRGPDSRRWAKPEPAPCFTADLGQVVCLTIGVNT